MLTTMTETGSAPFSVASAVLLSTVVHGVGFSLLSFGLLHLPKVQDPGMMERYSVRRLDVHSPAHRAESAAQGAAEVSNALSALRMSFAGDENGKQILLQPSFRTHPTFATHTPMPTLMIWSPELASNRIIVPPLPDQPTSVETHPSFDAPNKELTASQQPMAAASASPRIATPPAGTSSPIVTQAPTLLRMAPATVSRSNQQPTPTAVLSISEVRLSEGTMVLPSINETRALHGNDGTSAKDGNKESQVLVATETNSGTQGGTGTVASYAAAPGVVHITLPKDGRFGVVAIGTSVNDDYPETLPIWGSRVAYTVYLHVGLSKSWILQYSSTRTDSAQAGGVIDRLEAPWAYDILRPSILSEELNADALIVHGNLTETGRLDGLRIAFPANFPRTEYVLSALREWQFRPARQHGVPVAVEILLIIPGQDE